MLTRWPMKMAFASQSDSTVLDSNWIIQSWVKQLKLKIKIIALILCSILCSMYLYVHSMYNLEVI